MICLEAESTDIVFYGPVVQPTTYIAKCTISNYCRKRHRESNERHQARHEAQLPSEAPDPPILTILVIRVLPEGVSCGYEDAQDGYGQAEHSKGYVC